MEPLTAASIFISFLFTLVVLPLWIKRCKQSGLVWQDMNKVEQPKNVASSGGVVVVTSFILGILTYIAGRTFIFQDSSISLELFAIISTISIVSIVGFADDFLGWLNKGIPANFRLLLVLFASIPLVVINAGSKVISLPFVGSVDFGIFYPLLIIPIGIVGATTTYNFLAGFNGLEASQGIIIISFLSFIAYKTDSAWLAVVGMCMVFALIVFYIYNKYPARVFPGDSLTYSLGALIAIMAILGNFERIAIFIFTPYILETFLKLRGKLQKQSFAKPNSDGSLELKYSKIYGLTHLSIYLLKKYKKKVFEKEVVYLINLFQIVICCLALIIFREFIFI